LAILLSKNFAKKSSGESASRGSIGKPSPTVSAKPGWSWGCVSALDRKGRRIWIADAHRGDGKRFIVRADEELTAFLELERAVCIHLLTEQI
jgi:hypothetical protein